MEIVEMLKSRVCWLVLALGIAISLYVVRPLALVSQPDMTTGIAVILFLILFPTSLACNVRLVKSKFKEFRSVGKHGIANFILYAIGLTSLQTCLVSGVCGVNAAISILFLVLPSSLVHLFIEYSRYVLLAADLGLFISLLSMKCFSGKPGKGAVERPVLKGF